MRAPFFKVRGPWDAATDQWTSIVAEADEIYSAAAGDALERAKQDLRANVRAVGGSDELVNAIETNYQGGPSLDLGDESTYEEAEALELGTADKSPSAPLRGLFSQRGKEYGEIFSEGLTRRLVER